MFACPQVIQWQAGEAFSGNSLTLTYTNILDYKENENNGQNRGKEQRMDIVAMTEIKIKK